MSPPDKITRDALRLRATAEDQLANTLVASQTARHPAEDLLHELQVHQVELEMQNEALRQAQAALEDSRDRYVDLYNFAPSGYLSLNAHGMIEEVNLTAVTLLGVERKNLLQRSFTSLVVVEDQGRWTQHFVSVMKQDDEGRVQLTLQRRDGTVFPVLLEFRRTRTGADDTAPGVTDIPGGEHSIRIALTDISELRRMMVQQEESEYRWKFAVEGAGDGLWDWDIAHGTVFFSRRWKEILGFDEDEIGNGLDEWEKRIHPDDKAATLAAVKDYLDGKTPAYISEHRILCKDGDYRWILDRGMVVSRDEVDTPSRMIGTHGDITDRMQRDEALRERMKELNCLYAIANLIATGDSLERVAQGVVAVMPDGWLYPEIACVRIMLDGRIYQNENFLETSWQQSAEVKRGGQRVGTIEMYYREVRPIRDEGPFQREERTLLDAIAHKLSMAVDAKHAEAELNKHRNQLQELVRHRTAALEAANCRLAKNDQRLSAMFAMSQRAHELDEHEILRLGIEEAVRLTDSEIGYIHFVNADNETLTLGAWSQGTLQHCSASHDNHYPISSAGVWADTVRLRRAVVHNDYETLPGRKGYPEGHARLIRHLGVPVMEVGEVRLLIGVGNKAADYDDADVKELQLIGNDLWSIIMRHRAEADLSVAEERTRLILDSSADGILQTDELGHIAMINPAACRMLGYEPEQLLGRDMHASIHCSYDYAATSAATCAISSAMRDGLALRENNETLWCADGRPLPVSIATQPMIKGTKVIGAVLSFSDNTQRQAVEHAREAACTEAEQLARTKSEFLANMSHEIRTPLNGVLGMAQIGYRDNLGRGKTQETFARILESGNLLLVIINDILDLSKIEAGKLAVESVPVDPGYSVDAAVALLTEQAAEKGLALLAEKAPDLPAAILSDPTRITQILLNLLSNAIKFTPRGEVRVVALRDDGELVFRVTDTGIGMTPEQMDALFAPFHQADSGTTRKYGGTGLGLTISRQLAHLMGGDIHASSEAGRGSTFELRLPCSETTEAVKTAETASFAVVSAGPRLKGLRILAADDNEVNLFVLSDMLTREGVELEMVGNGRLAVEAVARDPARFDLVLMDVQMPEMDGLEATRQIRVIAPALPVVGQTAHVLPAEHAKCRAAGMVDTITKPLNLGPLVGIILRHARRAPAATVTSHPPPAELPGQSRMINWEQFKHRYADRPDFIPKLLGITLKTHAEAPALMRAAAASGDMEQLFFLAHTAKGTGGNVSAHALQVQAQLTETAARAASPDAIAHAEQLAATFDAVLAEIREYLA